MVDYLSPCSNLMPVCVTRGFLRLTTLDYLIVRDYLSPRYNLMPVCVTHGFVWSTTLVRALI